MEISVGLRRSASARDSEHSTVCLHPVSSVGYPRLPPEQTVQTLPRFLAIGVVALSSCASPSRTSDTEIAKLYASYVDAVKKMDTPAYMAYFTSDFSMRNPDGRMHDRAEMQKYQRINARTTKKVNAYSATIEAITHPVDADFAVIVLQQYDRDQAPLEAPDQPHRIQTSAVQREIWRRTPEGPKISRIEEIMVGPVSIDGKIQQ